jgi:uncharacterized membrane protein
MTTPIIMMALLMAPYGLLRLRKAVTGREFDRYDAGAIGLALLFILTGIGHFSDTDSMSQMLPAWVPGRVTIIYLTGVFELALAAGFLFRKLRHFTGWVTAAMLVLFFPANVYAAINYMPQGGHAWGPVYLLIRAPLQLIILAWVYRFAVRAPDAGEKTSQP